MAGTMAKQKEYAKKVKASREARKAESSKKRAAKKSARASKRTERQKARNVKKINKMAIKAEKKEKGAGLKSVTKGKKSRPSKLSPTGKIRRGVEGVKVTEGGAYAKYGKKTGAAKSFRSAFASASKEGKKAFKWDGRSYTTKKKQKGGIVEGQELNSISLEDIPISNAPDRKGMSPIGDEVGTGMYKEGGPVKDKSKSILHFGKGSTEIQSRKMPTKGGIKVSENDPKLKKLREKEPRSFLPRIKGIEAMRKHKQKKKKGKK